MGNDPSNVAGPENDGSVIPNLDEKLQVLVPEPEKRQAVATIIAQAWSGPLPPPVLLKQYDDLLPGLAERIVKMTEEQGKHRRGIERTVIEGQIRQSGIGQILGFTIGIFGLGCCLWLGLTGHETVASIVGSIDIVGLVAVFVTGKYMQKRELQKKKE